jgi:hypothetical protein
VTGYQIDAQAYDGSEVVTVTLSGAASFDTIIGLLRDLDARRPGRVLIDESGLRPGLVSPGHIGEIAAQWRNATALRAARIAVFARNPVIYGLNRMFAGLANAEGRVEVFNSRAEALTWLIEAESKR